MSSMTTMQIKQLMLLGRVAGVLASILGCASIASTAIAQTSLPDTSEKPSVPENQVLPELRSPVLPAAPASMTQVTSVSQLSDVRPTDWAFQALQSLVERYGCIVGYPNKTYRGNQAITRYEFAAGLNACLDKIQELIAAATADFVKKEDLESVKRLQEEFAAELAALRGRVDGLEVRTATLEKQQFSTTTRLSGEAIFSLSSAYGAYPGGNLAFVNNNNTGVLQVPGVATPLVPPRAGRDAEVVFNNRVRLNLMTSFSGKDLLITGLQAYNFGASSLVSGLGSGNSLASTLGYGDVLFGSSSNARLAFEPQFPTTNPQNLSDRGNNAVQLYKLLYIFPVANKLTLFAGTNAEVNDAFPSLLPWANDGQGAISRFGQLPASHRVSGGTSQTGLASAAGFIWNIAQGVDLRALYGSVNAAIPGNEGFPGTPLGAGLFNGSYVVATQLTLSPAKSVDIGLNYAHSYHQANLLGTGLSSADIGAILFAPNGAELARAGGVPLFAIADQGIQLNTFGATVAFHLSPKVTLAGSATYIQSELSRVNASTNFLSWLVGLQVKDVLTKGGSAGLLFGSPLNRIATDGRAVDPETATPYHLEGFLNLRLTDNISLTPGLAVIFNPEGFSENRTVYMPVIRTTFTF